MNPEAHKIVKEMEKAMPPSMDYVNINNPGATHSFLSIQMSRLLVLFAEDAEKSTDKLAGQTDRLAEQIRKLLEIANAQKQLAEEAGKQAENLSKQIDRLVSETLKLTRFTKTLVWLTIVLAVSTLVQIGLMFFDLFVKYQDAAKPH
jgi:hypothetical protein